MKNKLSAYSIITSTVESIKNNFLILAHLTMLLCIGNYVFLQLSALKYSIYIPYIVGLYLFYFCFFRIYFKKAKIWDKSVFFHSLGKFVIIILLAFAFLILLKLFLILLYLLAKSFVIFPDFYNFLFTVYHSFIDWEYANIIKFLFLFVFVVFTIGIPYFSWISCVLGKESSITFSILEVKGSYLKLLEVCFLTYVVLPLLFAVPFFAIGNLYISVAVSSIISVIQTVAYAEIYRHLFCTNNL